VRITDVTTIKLRYRMDVAMADAIHYMPERPTLLVHVHTDEGIVGLGEAAAYGGYLESTEALNPGGAADDAAGPRSLPGRAVVEHDDDPRPPAGRRGMLLMAVSGVDIALWDIIGQATKTPLYRCLAGIGSG
jgi:L-alanine-DL-glutamate epimerase-like enolase superfamily enzyme